MRRQDEPSKQSSGASSKQKASDETTQLALNLAQAAALHTKILDICEVGGSRVCVCVCLCLRVLLRISVTSIKSYIGYFVNQATTKPRAEAADVVCFSVAPCFSGAPLEISVGWMPSLLAIGLLARLGLMAMRMGAGQLQERSLGQVVGRGSPASTEEAGCLDGLHDGDADRVSPFRIGVVSCFFLGMNAHVVK